MSDEPGIELGPLGEEHVGRSARHPRIGCRLTPVIYFGVVAAYTRWDCVQRVFVLGERDGPMSRGGLLSLDQFKRGSTNGSVFAKSGSSTKKGSR